MRSILQGRSGFEAPQLAMDHVLLGAAKGKDLPESECAAPEWQRQPMRVAFTPAGAQPVTFAVHGRSADVAPEEEASSQ